MWSWTLNWGAVRDDIVIGSCPRTSADLDRIGSEAGATAVLSLQTDECRAALGIFPDDLARHAGRRGLIGVNAPMRDFDPAAQREGLPAAVSALAGLLAEGRRTYVHCTAGINRAPLTVLAYLTFVEGMTPDEAMALILRGRPEASPYWDSYYGCRSDAVERHRAAIERRARHLSERDPGRAPDAIWLQAEGEILSESFSNR